MSYVLRLVCLLMPFISSAACVKEQNYAFDYPSQWTSATETKIFVFKHHELGSQVLIQMIVTSLENEDSVTLNDFFAENVSWINDPHMKTGELVADNITSKWIFYTTSSQQFEISLLQYFIIKENVKYVLTFSIDTSSEFDDYLPVCEKIMSSFRFRS